MLLASGDHIVAGADIYGGTYRLLHKIVNRAGIDRVAGADDRSRGASKPRSRRKRNCLWIESPGNPLLSITDIAACAEIAQRHGVLLGVDNTFATPVLTRPLELGADIVMHSATKYIGGHSDVLGGALVVRDEELFDRLYFIQNATGAVMAPLESFLCSRGSKTLELRVREQCRTAAAAGRVAGRPSARCKRVCIRAGRRIRATKSPRRQMDGGFGAMLSFEFAGDFAAAKRVAESTKLFQLAVSLGAVESLIEQPASMSHASYDPAARAAHGITDGLIRLSVGLEAFEDLRDDLAAALARSRYNRVALNVSPCFMSPVVRPSLNQRIALLRRAVRERIGHDHAAGLHLQAVVADRLGAAQGVFHVAGVQKLESLLGMIGPHPGEEIGLQFQPHR